MSDRKIGASQAAAILGLSPFADPLDVWLEMSGRVSGMLSNATTIRGQLLEPGLREWYAAEVGATVHAGPKYGEPGWFVSPNVAARWDGWWADAAAVIDVEIKSVNQRAQAKFNDGIPVEYLIQTLVQLAARHPDGLTVKRCDLVAYVTDAGDPTVYPVERAGNDRRIEAIVERLERWHRDHIVADKPPEALTDEQRHALLTVLPVDVGVWTTPTDEDRALVADLAKARQMGRQAKAEEARILGALIDRVGVTNGLEALLRGSHVKGRVTLDTKALAKAHPDIFDQFRRVGSPSRRWTILDKTLTDTEDTDNE